MSDTSTVEEANCRGKLILPDASPSLRSGFGGADECVRPYTRIYGQVSWAVPTTLEHELPYGLTGHMMGGFVCGGGTFTQAPTV